MWWGHLPPGSHFFGHSPDSRVPLTRAGLTALGTPPTGALKRRAKEKPVTDKNHDADKSVSNIDEELTQFCERARGLWVEAGRSEVGPRYQVAMIVRAVKSESRYGKKGMKRLEETLEVDGSTLYRYAQVADAWSEEELNAIVTRRNTKSLALTWSHLEAIATETDRTRRTLLVEQALSESLSVRAIRQIVKPTSMKRRQTETAKSEDTNSPAGLLATLSAALDSIEQEARAWDQRHLKAFYMVHELTLAERRRVATVSARLATVTKQMAALAEAFGDAAEYLTVEPEEEFSEPVDDRDDTWDDGMEATASANESTRPVLTATGT